MALEARLLFLFLNARLERPRFVSQEEVPSGRKAQEASLHLDIRVLWPQESAVRCQGRSVLPHQTETRRFHPAFPTVGTKPKRALLAAGGKGGRRQRSGGGDPSRGLPGGADPGAAPSAGHVEVVALLVVVEHVLADAGRVGPSDEVLHGAGDQEGRVGHHLGPDAHVALLHEGDGGLHVLRHAELEEQRGQAAAAEGGGRDALALLQRALGAHQAQGVQLLQEGGRAARPEGRRLGRLAQVADAARQLPHGPAQLVVARVVLPARQAVAAQDAQLGQVPRGRLPVHQVELLEQLLLVELQLAHHRASGAGTERASGPRGSGRRRAKRRSPPTPARSAADGRVGRRRSASPSESPAGQLRPSGRRRKATSPWHPLATTSEGGVEPRAAASHGWSAKTHKKMGNKLEGIPEGKGPYCVGCTDLMTGPTTQGSFLRLYYPSQSNTSSEDTVWIPKKEYFCGLSDFLNLCQPLGEFVLSWYFGSATCPAKWDAAFKPGERYPLIIFSHGLGAFRTVYSAICIEMASWGFVVASVEHRDQSASATYYYKEKPSSGANGGATELQEEWMYYRKSKPSEDDTSFRQQQVQQRADECIRALDLLLGINSGKPTENLMPVSFNWTPVKDSIDVHRIAVMGHSFGAATAIETLSKDVRFKCGVALDAWMLPLCDEVYARVHQPLLFINSEKFQWASNMLEIKKLASTNRENKIVTIKGAVHQSFPDFTFVAGDIVGKVFKLRGEIDPYVAIDSSNKASLAFLQKHLGFQKGFDQWDLLVEGEGPHVIPGTNVELPPSEQ